MPVGMYYESRNAETYDGYLEDQNKVYYAFMFLKHTPHAIQPFSNHPRGMCIEVCIVDKKKVYELTEL
jgi:hypothetical protein